MNENEVLKNPRIFVRYWFEENHLTVKSNLVVSDDGTINDLNLLIGSMWLDYRDELRRYNEAAEKEIRGFPEKDLTKALDELQEEKRQDALDEVRTQIGYTGEDDVEIQRFVTAMTGRADEVELAVVKHLLWQIKRKMFGKKVSEHMMVIFRGRQGAGKTEAVRALFMPIKSWFKNASLREVTDDRWRHFLKDAYVIFCDELQHAEYASVDALKNILSAEALDSRRLGTNNYDNLVQNATFLGASNKPLPELIRDPTGMRRFFEITTLDKMDWETINSVDPLRIWRSVDEHRNEPYIALFKDRIREAQSELIVSDPEEEFLQEFGLLYPQPPTDTSVFISSSAFYSVYESYCKRNGERQKTHGNFSKKVRARGLDRLASRNGHGGYRGYLVPELTRAVLLKYKGDANFYEKVGKHLGEVPFGEPGEGKDK